MRAERGLRLGVACLVVASLACDDADTMLEPVQPGLPGVMLVASVPIPANYGIHDTFVRDGLAFVSAWNTGVMIFDVGNRIMGGSPSNPRLVSTTPTVGGETHNAWWFWNPHTGEKKYLFVGEEGPSPGRIASGDIHVLDVSDLAHPTEVAFFHLDSAGTHNFWMDEDAQILYAAYYNQGIIALDVSGSLNGDLSTRLIDSIRPGGGNTYTWGVQLQGSLYAIDMLTGFWQLELAGGKFTVLGGGNNVSERYSSDLAVGSNGFAYTGTWGSDRTTGVSGNAVKIWRLDVSGSPTLADSVIAPGIGTVSDIKVSPDGRLLMFTAERGPNSGFWFYSLQDPAQPALIGKYLVASGVHTGKFATIGGRLYAFGAQNPGATLSGPSPSTLLILDVTALNQ